MAIPHTLLPAEEYTRLRARFKTPTLRVLSEAGGREKLGENRAERLIGLGQASYSYALDLASYLSPVALPGALDALDGVLTRGITAILGEVTP